jgi:RNA polymerase sigma factor (sigma-70 family)
VLVYDQVPGVLSFVSDSLLQRIAAGDSNAVQACIDQYSGLVWSLARRLCPSHAEAEESVQEVFISVWENADRFDPSIASETTFIAMIARRRLIDRRRKQQRRPDHNSPVSQDDVQIADGRFDHDVAETTDEAARAVAALNQLRPEQREVLELSIMHGRKYEQIATTIGIPVGTVKTHARRGLIRLRELLQASDTPQAAEVQS